MLSTASLVSGMLTLAPVSPRTLDASQVGDIEVVTTPEASHVLVLDEKGEAVGSLVLWIDDEQRIRLDADFEDGVYLSAIVDGDVIELDTNDGAKIGGRVLDILALGDPQAGWFPCAFHTAVTVFEVAHANPFAVATAYLAACECLPELVEEFEDLRCPGFG